jgi:hypothetical protein
MLLAFIARGDAAIYNNGKSFNEKIVNQDRVKSLMSDYFNLLKDGNTSGVRAY